MATKQGQGRMMRYHHLTQDRCHEHLLAGWTWEATRIEMTESGQNDNNNNGAEQGGDSYRDNESGRDTHTDRNNPAPSTTQQS